MTLLRSSDGRARTSLPTAICKCGRKFVKMNSFQPICVPCARRVPIEKRKAEREQTAARRKALKTRNQWINEAQVVVNRYARLRDISRGYGCITCGAAYGKENDAWHAFDAGHMHSRGSRPELRFHLHNIALQCVKCNRFLGGSALEFRNAMVLRIGLAKVEALEAIRGPAKWSVDFLERLKRVAGKAARRLEKRIEARA